MDQVLEIAEACGARLSPRLKDSMLVAFEVLPSGEIEVQLADGTRAIVVSRGAVGDRELPAGVLTAETLLPLIGRFAALPIGARPEGRRFIRRHAIAADGERCIRYSEAGRDVV